MTRRKITNADIAALLERAGDLLASKGDNPFKVRSYRAAAISVRSIKKSLSKIVEEQGIEGVLEVPGVGDKLAALIVEYVETGEVEMLKGLPEEPEQKPVDRKGESPLEIPAGIVLEIDAEYRRKAAAGSLKKIAPRKLNPEKKAWLPIMNTERKGVRFTVMYSNTETAHKLGKTDDWVVVYYESGKGENQCTVVTESRGALKGKRVIRGRESECEQYYR